MWSNETTRKTINKQSREPTQNHECYMCSDGVSDCNSSRSDGHLSESEMDLDDDGFPIIEDEPDLGDEGGYVPTDGLIEPMDAYADLCGDAKRRKTAE